ncbi:MAG: DUF6600 domain-containing protein [Acidobacteriota bacterium]
MRRWFGILGMVVATFLAGGWIYGQSTPASTPQDKPPGVARISMIQGDVSIQRGDSADWVAAALNTPVMPGDKVSTGQDALSELQLDYANILRLSSQSVANVTTLDNAQIQVQLAQGLAFYTIVKGAEANAEIDTPNVALHPRGEGEFRIQVNPSGETVVMVRKGEADLSTSEGSTRVHKDQMITIHGTGADAQYQIAEAPSKDSWDKYNEDRDKNISSAQSWSHVDPYYTGAADLDSYGHWVYVPDYGWVWAPTVAPDWAPYREGNWVWEPYYGWTWASYEPWGWAPYHYGRWFSWRNSWVWWPGSITRGYRPIWAPAYVSFFGFGAGRFGLSFGFGFGFGSIGWLPIGPCDPYFPWYGGFGMRFGFADLFRFHNHDYFRGYPGAFGPLAARFDERFSNFRMAEQDSRFLRGVTSIRAEEFGHGTGQRAMGVSVHDFQNAHVITGGVPAVPTRESLAASNRAASPSTIRNEQGTRFFSRSQTQAAPRTSFNDQASRIQEALRGNGKSAAPQGGNQREGATAGSVNRPGAGSQPSTSTRPPSGSESRPGNSSAAAPNRSGQAAGTSESWQRFGNANGGGTASGRAVTAQPTPGAAGAGKNATPAGSTPAYRPPIYRPPANSGAQSTAPERNPGAAGNSNGWQRFTPRPAEPSAQAPVGRGNATAPQPRYQGSPSNGRGPVPSSNGRPSYSSPSYSRPPLNMSRPIISGPPRGVPNSGSSGRVGSAPRGASGGRSSGPSRRR